MNKGSLIRVLIIEENNSYTNLITELLSDSEDNFEFITVKTLKEGLTNFSGTEFDVAIFNWETDDKKSLPEIIKNYPDIPIITLVEDEKMGFLSIEQGAEDYLVKNRFKKDKNSTVKFTEDMTGTVKLTDEISSIIKKAFLRNRSDLDGSEGDSFSAVESKYFNVKVLKGYEQGLLEIIDFLPEATFVIDRFGRVVAWNHAIEELTGVEAEEMLGKGNHTYALPFYGKRRPILIDMVLDYDEEMEKEYKFIKREDDALLAENSVILKGEPRIVWIKAVPLYDNQYHVTGAIASIRDITGAKKSEGEIKKALKEKNILLKEIHHRVKNNLQIVSSLLGLQERYVENDSRTLDVLKESKNRIYSMAMVHEMLYQSPDIGYINFSHYIEKLTTNLYYAYQKPNTPMPTIDAENICLNIDTSIPLGLIISELVSNSLKYAFPDEETGEISVKLHRNDGEYELIIMDTGVGFPEDLDYQNTSSLGLKLVNSLVKQIDGTMELDGNKGTKFIIQFRELNYNKRM